MRILFFYILITLFFSHPAQSETPALERLTVQNLYRLEQVGSIQRGTSEEIAWSPDETRIAVIGSAGVRIYAIDTGKEHLLFGHMGGVNDVDFKPDGREIISAGDDGTLRVWDSLTGAIQRVFSPYADLNCTCSVTSAKYSADGRMIWVGAENAPLRVIDAQTGEIISEDPRHVLEIVTNPDRTRFAIIEQFSSVITLWPARGTFAPMASIDLRFTIWNAAFIPQTPYLLVSGFVGANLIMVDMSTLEEVKQLSGSRVLHANSLGSVVTQVIDWFENERRISLRVSVIDSTALQFNITIPVELTDARFSPSGDLIAVSDSSGRIMVWHWRYSQLLLDVPAAGSALLGLAILDNGLVASIDSGVGVVQTLARSEIVRGNVVRLWDITSGQNISAVNTTEYGLESADTLFWDYRSRRLIIGSSQRPDIQLELNPLTGEIRSVTSYNILFLSDDQYIKESPDRLLTAEAMSNDDVRLRDSGDERNVIVLRDSGPALGFTPDGKLLLTTGASGAIRMWGVRTVIPAAD